MKGAHPHGFQINAERNDYCLCYKILNVRRFFIEIPTHYLSSRESFVTFDEVHHIDIINKRVRAHLD
jgi:hypothetical protein